MKNTVIIYKSTTGFAQQYARWLSKELHCEVTPYHKRETLDLSSYETIIYGGGFYAGSINGIKWLKSKLPGLTEQKVIVFATGAMPPESPEIKEALKKNFTEAEAAQVKCFCLPGGLAYEKMPFEHRFMMKMFCKMLKKNDPETAQIISTSFDHTSKEALQPLIEYVKTGAN